MTSFSDIRTVTLSTGYYVDKLIAFLDENIAELKHDMFMPELRGLYCGRRPTPSLVIGLELDDAFKELVRRLRDRFNDRFAVENRTMDRINLAYNGLSPLSQSMMRQLQKLANETIAFKEMLNTELQWDLVLYEVMVDSNVVGVKHQFAEKRRWCVVEKGTGWGPERSLRMGTKVLIHRLKSLARREKSGSEAGGEREEYIKETLRSTMSS